jgi:hypothetical protein
VKLLAYLKKLGIENPKGMHLKRLLPAAVVAALVDSNEFKTEEVTDCLELGNRKKLNEFLGAHMNPPPAYPPRTH